MHRVRVTESGRTRQRALLVAMVASTAVTIWFAAWWSFSSDVDRPREVILDIDSESPVAAPVRTDDAPAPDVESTRAEPFASPVPAPPWPRVSTVADRRKLPVKESSAIRARVVDLHGDAIAAAHVRVGRPTWTFAGAEYLGVALRAGEPEGWYERATQTGTDGALIVDGLCPGDPYYVKVESDYRVVVRGPVRLPAREEVDLGVLVAVPAGRVTGRVVSDDGAPLAGTLVSPQRELLFPVRTSVDGEFDLGLQVPGQRAVHAREPGFALVDPGVTTVSPSAEARVNLRLAPSGWTGVGLVIDMAGRPLPMARLTVSEHDRDSENPPRRATVVAEEDGSFRFAHGRGARVSFDVNAIGCAPCSLTDFDPMAGPVIVRLTPITVIDLTARTAEGRPVTLRELRVARMSEDTDRVVATRVAPSDYWWKSDGHGAYRVGVATPGVYRVDGLAEGLHTQSARIEVAEGGSARADLRFGSTRPVEVRVVEATGGGVARASVTAVAVGEDAVSRTALTGADGIARLGVLSQGTYAIHAAFAQRAAELRCDVDLNGGSPLRLTLTLPPPSVVRGVLINRAGAPLPPCRVRLRPPTATGDAGLVGTWAFDGRTFVFGRVPEGPFDIEVVLDPTYPFSRMVGPTALRIDDAEVKRLVVGSGETIHCEVEVEWRPPGRVRGSVRIEGEPAAGAMASLYRYRDDDATAVWPEGCSASVDDLGAWALPAVEPGRYRVALGVGSQTFDGGDLEVRSGAVTHPTYELRVATLRGRVVGSDGTPKVAATLAAPLDFLPVSLVAPEDLSGARDGGSFTFEAVPVGPLRLVIATRSAERVHEVRHDGSELIVDM